MKFIANTRVCYYWLEILARKSDVVRKYFRTISIVSIKDSDQNYVTTFFAKLIR